MGIEEEKAKTITNYLADHKNFLSHARSININKAKGIGLKMEDTRETPELRTKIWQLWCTIERHFLSPAVKLFENSRGVSLQKSIPQELIAIPVQLSPSPPPQKKDT